MCARMCVVYVCMRVHACVLACVRVTGWALLVKVCAPSWISIVSRMDNIQGRCIRVNKALNLIDGEAKELRPCTVGEWCVSSCVCTCVHAHVG